MNKVEAAKASLIVESKCTRSCAARGAGQPAPPKLNKAHLSSVSNGKLRQHKGWKLLNE
jgi:hypothetical protein